MMNPNSISFNRQFVPQLTTCLNSARMSSYQDDFKLCHQFSPICLANPAPPTHMLHPEYNIIQQHEFYPASNCYQQQLYPVQVTNERNLYIPPVHNNTHAQQVNNDENVKESTDKRFVISNNEKILSNTRLEPISTDGPVMQATFYPHRIFVGSLSRDTTPVDLAMFFQRFGLVIETKIVHDSNGYSKGYGFVTFSSSKPVKTVLGLGSIYMGKKRIAVASAVRKKHADELDE